MIKTPREREMIETPREREADRDAERERESLRSCTQSEKRKFINMHNQFTQSDREKRHTREADRIESRDSRERERDDRDAERERGGSRRRERERVTEKLYTIREEKIHQHAQSVYTERQREETYERGRSDRESRLARKRER